MGDNDNLSSALQNAGKNKVINFKGGYFSFAFGNEIALVLKDISGYFILNCDQKLYHEVLVFIKNQNKTLKEIVDFWITKSKSYRINFYSEDFNKLRNFKGND